MQVILLRDIPGVGQRGAIKNVSDGYALNSLIPKKLAQIATPDALKKHSEKVAEDRAHREAQERAWDSIFEKIQKFNLMVRANASAQGHLYKKIDADDIAKVLREQGVDVPEEAIRPKMAIKQTGLWPVEIKLGEKSASINVEVIAS